MITLVETDERADSLAREIKSSNERCQYLKQQIERTLRQSRDELDSLQPIVHLLEAYRDELALHFALEIASDSFKNVIAKAPRLTDRASELLDEQEHLYTEIRDIAESLYRYAGRGVRNIPQAVVDRWDLFNVRLRQHDAAERELIYDAFFVDIGVGD